jgi:hypothetical protein
VAPATSKNFDAAPAPTLLYSKAKILKRTKVYTHLLHFILYDIAKNMNWMGYKLFYFVSFFNS